MSFVQSEVIDIVRETDLAKITPYHYPTSASGIIDLLDFIIQFESLDLKRIDHSHIIISKVFILSIKGQTVYELNYYNHR